MNREKFNKKVEQELENLTREQVVHFAWRCAVRALPFLGSDGSFNFWDKKDRQKYIYDIFYAIDINPAYAGAVYDAAHAGAAAHVASSAHASSSAHGGPHLAVSPAGRSWTRRNRGGNRADVEHTRHRRVHARG